MTGGKEINKGCVIRQTSFPCEWPLVPLGTLDPMWITLRVIHPRGEGTGVFIHQFPPVFGWECVQGSLIPQLSLAGHMGGQSGLHGPRNPSDGRCRYWPLEVRPRSLQ